MKLKKMSANRKINNKQVDNKRRRNKSGCVDRVGHKN